MDICYSVNEEEFNLTSVGDVFDTLEDEGRMEEGAVYYEADCRRMQASDVVSVEQVLDDMGERLYEEVGEIADDYPAVTPEAKDELKAFLHAWVENHADPSQYWIVVGKTREKRVTADDLTGNARVHRLRSSPVQRMVRPLVAKKRRFKCMRCSRLNGDSVTTRQTGSAVRLSMTLALST